MLSPSAALIFPSYVNVVPGGVHLVTKTDYPGDRKRLAWDDKLCLILPASAIDCLCIDPEDFKKQLTATRSMVQPIEFDQSSTASNPGGLTLSETKLRVLEPWMFGFRRLVRKIGGMFLIVNPLDMIDRRVLREHLACGDARAALVVSISPVLVAAYSDDLDCVAMLRFPSEFAVRHKLTIGTRLVTINTYYSQFVDHADLTFGPEQAAEWSGFFPLIAEFMADDQQRIASLKVAIDETEWRRCQELGEAYLIDWPGVARQGRPRRAHQPAGFTKQVVVYTLIGILGIALFVVLAWMFL